MVFLYMSFSAGCIVLFTVGLRALFKKKLPIELFCGLWWLAMLRALVPFTIPSDYSIYNGKISIERWLEKSIAFTLSERVFAEQAGVIVSIVCMILILSVAVFAARYFVKAHRYCSEIAEDAAPLQNAEIKAALEGLKLPMKGIRIKTSDFVDSPVSYGFFHPVIILPKNLTIENQETLQCILLHEGVHIRYLHYIWKIMSVLVVCVHWFNPCMWLLYWYMEKDTEIFCDKKVVQLLHEDKKEMYARTLLNMAVKQRESVVFGNRFVQKGMLKERILMIMHGKKNSPGLLLVSLFLFVGTAVVFATTDISVAMNEKNNHQIQVMEVSAEKVCIVDDEEIDMVLSYEELKPYLYSEDAEGSEKSVSIKDYRYTAKTPSPAAIHVSMEKNGKTYTGRLTYSHGEETAGGTYVGYYCGSFHQ